MSRQGKRRTAAASKPAEAAQTYVVFAHRAELPPQDYSNATLFGSLAGRLTKSMPPAAPSGPFNQAALVSVAILNGARSTSYLASAQESRLVQLPGPKVDVPAPGHSR